MRSIVGQRFGKQVVTKELGRGRVEVLCDCGVIKSARKQYLLNGQSKSCGCGRYAARTANPVAPGQHFGLLLVVERLGPYRGRRQVLVACRCGAYKVVSEDNLRDEQTKSCGCLRQQRMHSLNYKHGETRTALYRAWQGMWNRIRRTELYPSYKRNNIHIASEWRDYTAFRAYILEYLGECPPKHTLDRIDNTKGYEPGNVKWSTAKQQARNRSSNVILTVKGVSQTLIHWSEQTGLSSETIQARRRRGWSDEDAVLTPAQEYAKQISVQGVSRTINEWAHFNNIPRATIIKRLTLGWNPDKAVTAPARRKKV